MQISTAAFFTWSFGVIAPLGFRVRACQKSFKSFFEYQYRDHSVFFNQVEKNCVHKVKEQFEIFLKMEQDQEMGDLDQELLKVMLFEHWL